MTKSKKITVGVLCGIIFICIVIFSVVLLSEEEYGQANLTDSIPSSKDNILIPKESSSHISNYIYVKYRSGSVDIAHPRFEYLNTSKSSFVRGAWYDDDNQYMVINLNGTYYHYCGMPKSTWTSFKSASSFGRHYNAYIKGKYDCRIYPVPQYKKDTKSDSGSVSPSITVPSSGGGYYSGGKTIDDVYVYDCEGEGEYCYGEDEYGNEIEIYVYEMEGGYGYGEDDYGNEVEFYYDDY